MDRDKERIARWRLRSQQLTGAPSRTVQEAVGSLGGIQAQDDTWAKWSIGLRLRSVTEAGVTRAIADSNIVRTWAFRGTLHFLTAEDVGWVTALLAPRIVATNQRRYRQLELDSETFARSDDVLARTLAGGRRLIRAEIARALENEGISAAGQRLPYLLQRAALDGLICLGPSQGREATYVLLEDWVPASAGPGRDEALARLAQRYFTGHGPATIQDFAWWSGLLTADARTGLESARSLLVQVTAGGKKLWAGQDFERLPEPAAHLLPPFDEYLLGYKDRTAMVEPEYVTRINAGGGMPKPTVVAGGKVVGTWKRAIGKGSITVRTELFSTLDRRAIDALTQASRRLGEFYALPIEMAPKQQERKETS